MILIKVTNRSTFLTVGGGDSCFTVFTTPHPTHPHVYLIYIKFEKKLLSLRKLKKNLSVYFLFVLRSKRGRLLS